MTHPLDPASPDYEAMQDAGRSPSHHDPTEYTDVDDLIRAAAEDRIDAEAKDDLWAAYDGMGPLEAWDADGNR